MKKITRRNVLIAPSGGLGDMIWALNWAREGDAFVIPWREEYEPPLNWQREWLALQWRRLNFLLKVYPSLTVVVDEPKWRSSSVEPLLMPHADFERSEKSTLLWARRAPNCQQLDGGHAWAFALSGSEKNPREVTRRLPEGMLYGVSLKEGIELPGAGPLEDMWTCLSSCSTYVGVDSAPAHLAAAMGLRTGVLMPRTNADPRWAMPSMGEISVMVTPRAVYQPLVYDDPQQFQQARSLARRFLGGGNAWH